MWFGDADNNGDPDLAGQSIGFRMASGTPPTAGWVSFYADVTNTTHYDLNIGFVQTVDFTRGLTYANGVSKSVSGTAALDAGGTINTAYMYADVQKRINKGQQFVLKPILGDPVLWNAQDSPDFAFPALNPEDSKGCLSSIQMQDNYHTSVVVAGVWAPSGSSSPGVGGWPIALSTAEWHLAGLVAYTASGPLSNATVLNPANWSVSLDSGSGPFGGTWPAPGTAASSWTATGDGGIKYLRWNGTANDAQAQGYFYATADNFATAVAGRPSASTQSDSRSQRRGRSPVRDPGRLGDGSPIRPNVPAPLATGRPLSPRPVGEPVVWRARLRLGARVSAGRLAEVLGPGRATP